MGDGELGCADWVSEVDVEAGVAIGRWSVFGRGFAGWVPEIRKGLWQVSRWIRSHRRPSGTNRLIHSSAWTNYIRSSKLLLRDMEHAF